MTKRLAILAALFLAALPAQADFGNQFGWRSESPPVTVTACAGRTSTSNLTTYALNTNACGSFPTDVLAYVVVAIAGEDAATVFGVSSASIDTIACTEVVDEDGTGIVNTAIYICGPQTGLDSIDYSVTFSEAVTSIAVKGYVVTGLNSKVATSATTDDHAASGALVLDLPTTMAGGVAIGVCNNSGAADSATWVGITEDTDSQHAEADFSFANVLLTASGSLTASCDWTGLNAASGAAAAFR